MLRIGNFGIPIFVLQRHAELGVGCHHERVLRLRGLDAAGGWTVVLFVVFGLRQPRMYDRALQLRFAKARHVVQSAAGGGAAIITAAHADGGSSSAANHSPYVELLVLLGDPTPRRRPNKRSSYLTTATT